MRSYCFLAEVTLKDKITEDENDENVPHLEITEIVLVHCNILNNDSQQDSRILYTVVYNKSFGQLLDISPKNFMNFKKLLTQNCHILKCGLLAKLLEIEDKINITLVIN